MSNNRSAVERRHPPNALMRLANPVVRGLVRRGRAADQLMILSYQGRRTGRRFAVPVGYHMIDGVPSVLTNSEWPQLHSRRGGRGHLPR